MTKHWTVELERLGACPEAVAWCRDYATPQAAWDACQRGDWMAWLFEALEITLPANYQAKRAPLDADYRAKYDALWADYEAKCATLIRSLIPACPL